MNTSHENLAWAAFSTFFYTLINLVEFTELSRCPWLQLQPHPALSANSKIWLRGRDKIVPGTRPRLCLGLFVLVHRNKSIHNLWSKILWYSIMTESSCYALLGTSNLNTRVSKWWCRPCAFIWPLIWPPGWIYDLSRANQPSVVVWLGTSTLVCIQNWPVSSDVCSENYTRIANQISGTNVCGQNLKWK